MKPAVTILFLSAFAVRAMGQTHVQEGWNYQTTTATSISQAFPAASGTGDLIVVELNYANAGVHVNTVTDSKSNTYKRIGSATSWNGGAYGAELWYAYNITGTTGPAKITVTATLSGAPTGTPNFSQLYISEYSGIAGSIDPLDQSSAATGSTVAISSGSKTTTYTNELIYGAAIGASASIPTHGTGFITQSTQNSNLIEDKNVASMGANSATFTASGTGNWVSQMATFISTISTLPVSFSSFTGQCGSDGNTRLDWTTAQEINNDYFTVQESIDGSSWMNIGTIKAAGNSAAPETYAYTNNATTGPVTYYRIRQTDLDGQFTYSKVVTVNSCTLAVSGLSIYPNPVNGSSLTGRIDMAPYETFGIEVVNALGHVITRGTIHQAEFRVELPGNLPAGLYYARIASVKTASVTPFLVK
jgi:hypothetical protein